MIYKIKGVLTQKEEDKIVLELNGIFYEISIPKTVFTKLSQNKGDTVELIIYHYLNIDKSKATPVLIGFVEELEKDFFEKFIGVSGVGPKAALRAFDRPIPAIAKAIEAGDLGFLQTLVGIGKQKARHVVAHLQGKVGRFALIKEGECKQGVIRKEIVEEAREILKRLQYSSRESENMIQDALRVNPEADSPEELLNEIYRQRK